MPKSTLLDIVLVIDTDRYEVLGPVTYMNSVYAEVIKYLFDKHEYLQELSLGTYRVTVRKNRLGIPRCLFFKKF